MSTINKPETNTFESCYSTKTDKNTPTQRKYDSTPNGTKRKKHAQQETGSKKCRLSTKFESTSRNLYLKPDIVQVGHPPVSLKSSSIGQISKLNHCEPVHDLHNVGEKAEVQLDGNNSQNESLDTFVKQLHVRWRPQRLKRMWRSLCAKFRKHDWKKRKTILVHAFKHYKKEKKRVEKEAEKERKQQERLEKKEKKRAEKEAEKERKQQERHEKKMLQAPSAGTKVKGRDGSTRHGFVISYSSYHRPKLTVQEIEARNSTLNVCEEQCFWCKIKPKEDLDHAHPCCSMSRSEYSWTNNLNIFPSCKSCNSTKGGTPLSEWLVKIHAIGYWDSTQIATFNEWLQSNVSKLVFGDEHTQYVEKQFVPINTFHKIAEYCAKHKKDINDFVSFNLPGAAD